MALVARRVELWPGAELSVDAFTGRRRQTVDDATFVYVQSIVAASLDLLDLRRWSVRVRLHRARRGGATCSVDLAYRIVCITVNAARVPADQWPQFLLHELLHVVLWPMAEAIDRGDQKAKRRADKAHEQACTHLELALLPVLRSRLTHQTATLPEMKRQG